MIFCRYGREWLYQKDIGIYSRRDAEAQRTLRWQVFIAKTISFYSSSFAFSAPLRENRMLKTCIGNFSDHVNTGSVTYQVSMSAALATCHSYLATVVTTSGVFRPTCAKWSFDHLTWHSLHFFFTGPACPPLATVYSWQPIQRVCNAVLVFGGAASSALCLWHSWQGCITVSVGWCLWWQVVHCVMLRSACFLCAKVTLPGLAGNWITALSSGIIKTSAITLLTSNESKAMIETFKRIEQPYKMLFIYNSCKLR